MRTQHESSVRYERKRRQVLTRKSGGRPARAREPDPQRAAAEGMEPGTARAAHGNLAAQPEEVGARSPHAAAHRIDEAPGGAGGVVRGAGPWTSGSRAGAAAGTAERAGDVHQPADRDGAAAAAAG